MFLADRQQMLEFINALGSTRCMYGTWPDGPCDCKFGWRPGGSRPITQGEQTGCPELRTLRTILTALTDDEWATVVAREGHVIAGTAGAPATHLNGIRREALMIRDALERIDEQVAQGEREAIQ